MAIRHLTAAAVAATLSLSLVACGGDGYTAVIGGERTTVSENDLSRFVNEQAANLVDLGICEPGMLPSFDQYVDDITEAGNDTAVAESLAGAVFEACAE